MLAPGALLQNRYRIVRLCDKQPTCSVYEAIDQRFASTVTVRECEGAASQSTRNAFLREARLLNNHFHVALPHAFDVFAEGNSVFSVVQHVPGETLANVLQRRDTTFELALVLRWLDRLLDLLADLASSNPPIVHTNISPACIKVTPRDDAVITDFSLCLDGPGVALAYVLPYAPYEQIQGQRIDASADVYALAATFYHLLTMEPPPNAYERMAGWAEGAPVVLRSMDELNPSIPRAVAFVFDRALALQREDRTPTAAEMRAALRKAAGVTAAVTPTAVVSADDLLDTTNAPTVALDPRHAITDGTALKSLVDSPRTSVICRTCGSANDPQRVFCPFCGSLLRLDRRPAAAGASATVAPEATVACPGCGASNRPDARQCRMCLAALEGEPAVIYDLETSTDSDGPTEALDDDLPATAKIGDGHEPEAEQTVLGQLLVLEGEEPGKVLPLHEGETTFGRAEGDHTFPLDIFMSGRHAKIVKSENEFVLQDVGSRNGTFLKIRGETPLRAGDIILAGKQLLSFDPDDISGRAYLRLLQHSGAVAESYELNAVETRIGRTKGDITFTDDTSMAEHHATIVRRDSGYYVSDTGTKNGTFLRLKTEVELLDDDIIILGKHIFRLELSSWTDDYATLKGI